jgi:hypothetical protein
MTALIRQALESTGKYLVKVEQDSRLALHAAPWFLPDLILLDAAKAEAEGEDVKPSTQIGSGFERYAVSFSERKFGFREECDDWWISRWLSLIANAVSLDDLLRCVDEMLNPAPAKPITSGPAGADS